MQAYFHEDDYNAVEILPLEAWAHCEQQLGRIAEHDVEHGAPGGLGWTSLYVRQEATVSLADLGLTLTEVDAALSAHLLSTDDVATGFSTYREAAPRTRAWLVKGYTALYASRDESGRVRALFCSTSDVPPEKRQSFIAALQALGRLRPLLLVDWQGNALLRLDDAQGLQHWLAGDEEER